MVCVFAFLCLIPDSFSPSSSRKLRQAGAVAWNSEKSVKTLWNVDADEFLKECDVPRAAEICLELASL